VGSMFIAAKDSSSSWAWMFAARTSSGRVVGSHGWVVVGVSSHDAISSEIEMGVLYCLRKSKRDLDDVLCSDRSRRGRLS
jgi:hypothetical protein